MPGDLRQSIDEVRRQVESAVSRPAMLRDGLGKGTLVEFIKAGEGDGEGLDRKLGRTPRSRNDRARIDAAAEKSPNWHIRDHVGTNGLVEALLEALDSPFVSHAFVDR